ncbi:MAG: adenylosuccinate synthase [Candidatus Pacebacteria bacterium]|nr:adenylosuccinate synthase [Candidatus Paceibacterota bacterium]
MEKGYVDVLLGLQWGDEGKGKIVDYLSPQYDIIARFQGGPNAGHTLYVKNKEGKQERIVLHVVPSGLTREDELMGVLGNGMVICPIAFKDEIKNIFDITGIDVCEKLIISTNAHMIVPTHRLLDKASEIAKGKGAIGTTGKGIGPCYMDKAGRNGIRFESLIDLSKFNEEYLRLENKHREILKQQYGYTDEQINAEIKEQCYSFKRSILFIRRKMIRQIKRTEYWLNEQIREGKKVLAEGAQGTMLDIDHGTYPFVTSSSTIAGGACTGLGISPLLIRKVIGVTKAYCTRVGNGEFPTEITDQVGEQIRKDGNEFGSTTGRPRRCGWMDFPALEYSFLINGVTDLIITKIDVFKNLSGFKVCSEYMVQDKVSREYPVDCDKALPLYELFEFNEHERMNLGNITDEEEFGKGVKQFIFFMRLKLENTGVQLAGISNGPECEKYIDIKSLQTV